MLGLDGLIDPHVHSAPDIVPRLLDDISLVRQALEAKMYGILLKSHTALTADRATIAAKMVPGIRVWGGLVLNHAIGGFNPAAVEMALAYGAAEIWMPTHDAANHLTFYGKSGRGLALERDMVPDSVHEILELVGKRGAILGTGHLSSAEIRTLVPMAREHGVKKILVTHPEAPFINLPITSQRELAALGCLFERTWVFTTPALGSVMKPDRLVQDIRDVGCESTVLATDMGQVGNPTPVEGFQAFVQTCRAAGFDERDIQRMAKTNIKDWLIEGCQQNQAT
jgi:uncharacterized protein DUF6282